MRDVSYVNNTGIIAQNPKMTAINSCIEIDLTGQVVSDSIGTRMYSGKFFLTMAKYVLLSSAILILAILQMNFSFLYMIILAMLCLLIVGCDVLQFE